MLVSERKTEAETWLAQMDGFARGVEHVERMESMHAIYRAAAITVMNYCLIERSDKADGIYDGLLTRRVGERQESFPVVPKNYQPSLVAVGVARDLRVSVLPAFLRRDSEPVISREEFYIRGFTHYTSGKEPDVSVEGWSVQRGDFRLPDKGVVGLDIHRGDALRFGREIAHLAVGLECQLPQTLEECQAVELNVDL